MNKKLITTHGLTQHPLYKTWDAMHYRCYSKSSSDYKIYGGRGIKVSHKWHRDNPKGIENFIDDMGDKPSSNHSIDRIDVNGNYSPKNCRWAKSKTQAINRRNTKKYVAYGKRGTITAWAKYLSIAKSTIYRNLNKGKSFTEIVKYFKPTPSLI